MSVGTDDIIDNAVTDAKISLDSVYTVWRESLGVDNLSRILFKRNTISFDPSIIVSHTGSFGKTAVAVSGDNVYVVSQENITEPPASDAIWYRRSTDGGANFGSTVNLTENTAADAEETAMAASGNNVYVLWSNFVTGSSSDILYKKSTNGGTSFGDTKNLSNTAGSSREPAVAVSGNNVYVVWRERESTTPGNQEILYRRSTNAGANFGSAVNLSNSTGLSQIPAITASGNNVYVVWQDDSLVSGIPDILYRRSTNGGTSFSGAVNLSNTAGNSGSPAIAASGNNVYVVWHDNTTQVAGAQFDILYRKSTNGGTSFGSTVNLSNTAQASTIPAIAASNNLT